jgi:hypothetical protein
VKRGASIVFLLRFVCFNLAIYLPSCGHETMYILEVCLR